jgi:SWI/SNF-related matrix-associated actin-dependent regulator 1 of chromatin subfamily A
MELYPHQKIGVDWLKKKQKGILADEMGLGKTYQAIVASGESGEGTAIVVCPASLKSNWEREINTIYEEDVIHIVSGRKETQEHAWKSAKSAWTIINYDILEAHVPWILAGLENGTIDTIILDEAHYIKGKTKRADAAVEICKKAKNVYALTGTPILNRPIELWNMLVAISHRLSTTISRSEFSKRYCDGHLEVIPPKGARKYPIRFWKEEGATNLVDLREQLKGSILRRKKKDELELPEKIIGTKIYDMTPAEQKEYDSAWDVYMDFLTEQLKEYQDDNSDALAVMVGEHAMQEAHAELHAQEKIENAEMARHIIEINKLKQVASLSKVSVIMEDTQALVDDGESVIIFSQYTGTIDRILAECKKAGIKAGSLTGKTPTSKRDEVVQQFQNGDIKVFVGQIKAAGVGITLTKANTVLFADMDWTPEMHSQAEDRAHRIGQTGTVSITYYIASGTVDEDVIELLTKKKAIVQEILDGTKNRAMKKSNMLEDFVKRMSEKVIT